MDDSNRRQQTVLIYLLAFVCAIGNPVVLPSLPFIMRDFGLSPLEMGLIISVFALPGIAVIPLYGVLSDRIGRRPLLLAGLTLCGAGSLLCYTAPGFSWLLAGRALQGLSLTPLEAMCNTLISDLYEGEERMRFVTKATAMQYFSIAVTPLMVSWLLSMGSWRLSLLAAAALCFGALLFCLPIRLPYRPSRSVSFGLYASHIKTILASPRVLSLFSVRFGAALILFGAIYPHISLLAEEKLLLPPQQGSLLFAVYAAGMFLGALFSPMAMRSLPPRLVGFLGGAQVAVSMLLLLFCSTVWQALPGLLFVGTGAGMLNACCAGHVSLSSTPDTRGSIMSAYSTIFRIGQFCAPLLFGLFYQQWSFSGVFGAGFFFALAVTFAAALSFAYAHRLEHSHTDI